MDKVDLANYLSDISRDARRLAEEGKIEEAIQKAEEVISHNKDDFSGISWAFYRAEEVLKSYQVKESINETREEVSSVADYDPYANILYEKWRKFKDEWWNPVNWSDVYETKEGNYFYPECNNNRGCYVEYVEEDKKKPDSTSNINMVEDYNNEVHKEEPTKTQTVADIWGGKWIVLAENNWPSWLWGNWKK